MSVELSYLSVFLVGLLGGVHCVGMCGGIVGALSMNLSKPAGTSTLQTAGRQLPFLLAYNLGRIASYTLAGILFGGIGALVKHWISIHYAQLILQAVAGLFMLALGLYLAGWWRGLTRLERMGGRAWKHIEPLGRRFIPARSFSSALALGMVWGWLPCGLVYSVLTMSMATGNAMQGGVLMLSFALGTLPNLLLMGVFAGSALRFAQKPGMRTVAGLLVMGFGVYTLVNAMRFLVA